MKRKRTDPPNDFLLKWNAFLFAVFTVGLWLSVLNTINYPGNWSVSFEVFEPFIIERMSVNIIWGVILIAHFAFHHLRQYIRLRRYAAQIASIYAVDDPDVNHHLTLHDGELELIADDEAPVRQRKMR